MPELLASKVWAMFVNFIPIDVIGGAYAIAANYLTMTGPNEVDFHQPLFDSIVKDYQAGNRNRLHLANRAIARIEKAGLLELNS